MTTFNVPDLGEGLTEADIIGWLVSVGDTITVDQPIVEVETAKSTVEIPAPYAGRVSTLHGDAGDTMAVGSPLITVETDDNHETYRHEEQAGSGNVLVGYGTSTTQTRRRRRPHAQADTNSSAAAALRVSSPLVRKIADDAGVELQTLEGSGPDGLIMRADVRQAADARTPADHRRAATAHHTRTPMSAFDRAMAESLGRSRREIPEATVWVDVDFTELFTLRKQAEPAQRIGLMGYLGRFTVAALRQYPQLNAQLDAQRQERITFDDINLSIAVAAERGLITPAVVNAHTMTTRQLDTAITDLVEAARAGDISPQLLTAGTFTLNNYGAFNVDGSAAIINHPQVAILGFGRIIDRPWAVDGSVTVRKIGQMSFVFDHRVCDGAVAAGFMRTIADAIENPATAIAGL